jgi:hypothetical protein
MMQLAFAWLEHSWLGIAVNESKWAFAALEAGHLLSLAMLGGAVLLVDLRILGWGLKEEPIRKIARAAQPWLIAGLAGMIVTGVPLLASLAGSKYYGNEAFRLKMCFLAAALLFTFTIRQRFALREGSPVGALQAKMIAVTSVLLWSGVGIMGRGIGFY